MIVGTLSTIAIAIEYMLVYLGTMTSRVCLEENGVRINSEEESSYFSSHYKESREKFLDAAHKAGGSVDSIKHPEVGPEGEPLFIDVAYFGSVDNKNTLVVSSGTHGVEGFAGSGIQTGLLREGVAARLPLGLSLVMIHALNPYGMAYLRRFTEDNVDLNRNFTDHSQTFPINNSYETLSDVIAPTSISFWSEAKSWWRLLWFRLTAGKEALQAAVSGGQYSHSKGLFYGGRYNTWSNKMVRSIAQRYMCNANRVVIVDVHTGLGEYGNAEVILNTPVNSPEYQRAVETWGSALVKTTVTGESASIHLDTSLKLAFTKMLPNSEVTAVSLEFGTVPPMEIFKVLRAENWLHHHGGSGYAKAREIKARLLRAFYPDDKDWKKSIWTKGKDVVERAVASFSSKEKIVR